MPLSRSNTELLRNPAAAATWARENFTRQTSEGRSNNIRYREYMRDQRKFFKENPDADLEDWKHYRSGR